MNNDIVKRYEELRRESNMRDAINKLFEEKDSEIDGLNRVISKMFADKVSESRAFQTHLEDVNNRINNLKLERDKFEGGDELKSKKINELENEVERLIKVVSGLIEDYNKLQEQADIWKYESGN